MKVRTQKTLAKVNGCPQRARAESEWYGGAQTFMWMCEDNIVEVPFDKEHLFEQILSPANLNRAYKAVMRKQRLWWYRQDVVRAFTPMALDQ